MVRFGMRFAIGLSVLFALCQTAVAAIAINSVVVFGDSLSDIGNTTHILKSLRKQESPSYLVKPFKSYVLGKMDEFADDYHVPQRVLNAGKGVVTEFFDHGLANALASLVTKIKKVPILPQAPYYEYRYSNGYVWNEFLAMKMGLNLHDDKQYLNQAFSGSWAVTYDRQLTVWNMIRHPIGTLQTLIAGKLVPPSLGLVTQTYLMVYKKASPDALYFIFSGGNDYLNVLRFEDNYNPAVMTKYVNNVISGIESSTKRLIKAGAKHIVLFGVPNVGRTPHFIHTLDESVLTQATHWHNVRLAERVVKLRRDYPRVKFTFIDVEPLLADVIEQPEQYGLSDVTEACIDVKLPNVLWSGFAADKHPFKNNFVLQYAETLQYIGKNFAAGEKNYQVCDNPDQYLFWDEVHPTKVTHRVLAEKVCQNLQANGYEVQCNA